MRKVQSPTWNLKQTALIRYFRLQHKNCIETINIMVVFLVENSCRPAVSIKSTVCFPAACRRYIDSIIRPLASPSAPSTTPITPRLCSSPLTSLQQINLTPLNILQSLSTPSIYLVFLGDTMLKTSQTLNSQRRLSTTCNGI